MQGREVGEGVDRTKHECLGICSIHQNTNKQKKRNLCAPLISTGNKLV